VPQTRPRGRSGIGIASLSLIGAKREKGIFDAATAAFLYPNTPPARHIRASQPSRSASSSQSDAQAPRNQRPGAALSGPDCARLAAVRAGPEPDLKSDTDFDDLTGHRRRCSPRSSDDSNHTEQ
jgi:hypothetical protein